MGTAPMMIGVRRKLASGFTYAGMLRPDGHVPEYHPAIFASFPISNLAVVLDLDGGSHNEVIALAAKAGVPVDIVEE